MSESEYDAAQPAYENGPKEVNKPRRMTNSKEQAGKLADMTPQEGKKVATKAYVKEELKEHNKKYHHGEKPYHRHKEHR